MQWCHVYSGGRTGHQRGAETSIKLELLVRAGSTPQKSARRCQVILLAHQGVSNHAIAQQTGLSRPTVLAARAAFAKRGTAGICEPQKRKRPRPRLTAELEQRILDTTLKTRPVDATHWSARVLAAKLGVSRMMVQRVWQRYDAQPHRVEKFKISNDPNFEDKVRDIVGLYLNPPDGALVLCVDEKSQLQALDRFTPTSSSWLNQVERWFRLITDKMIRRGPFPSVPELEHAIYAWLASWNDTPKAFVWKATADVILDKVSRCKELAGTAH